MNPWIIRLTVLISFSAWVGSQTEPLFGQATAPSAPLFVEENGLLVVEAEHFVKQTQTEHRKFYLTQARQHPNVLPDGDAPHVEGASNHAYLEILPDTRRTHDDPLIKGQNFSNEPGKQAVLHYRVRISNPGRYYVWVRAFSTGSEDNGLHVGLNGTWPESGQRLQWCEGKHQWRWESKQRTKEQHCGVPHQIFLDIQKPGEHVIQFSMREDGFEFDKWFMTLDRDLKRPDGVGPAVTFVGDAPPAYPRPEAASPSSTKAPSLPARQEASSSRDWKTSPTNPTSDLPVVQPRMPDGNGTVELAGEMKCWHKITLTGQGPFAHENDNQPNPFTDYRMEVKFQHDDGTQYVVPGYFAADGAAAHSSAKQGICWRAHFAPDREGRWTYQITFVKGPEIALNENEGKPIASLHGKSGSFEVQPSDKTGRDFRAHGRLNYVGKRYLQHAGSGRYFLKAGADAPETLLAFRDFDDTVAPKKRVPLKTYQAHLDDWNEGDPVWKNGLGKGLIGAINYLANQGCNAFSFLTYNAGGDGDNVWPFVQRDDKLHYDCSKLDQWEIVFEHATRRGMYLHFKLQETEMDDHSPGVKGNRKWIPTSLDGGYLGNQRKLYLREMIARFGHHLALNWNLGEENTQTTSQQKAMINFIDQVDGYDHPIVLHTYPDQQDKVYRPLLGDPSGLHGLSLQNSAIQDTHRQTLKWIEASHQSGRPWVVAFDESGSAAHGQCPDLGYEGFHGQDQEGTWIYTEHEVRHYTLWGHLMAGGAGCEYYFGYKLPQNDLVCEDWRSRDRSWAYAGHALAFFADHKIPISNMENANGLIGNTTNSNTAYCLAQTGEVYVVYLPRAGRGQTAQLDLTTAEGNFQVHWFNPRLGGQLQQGSVTQVTGGKTTGLGKPPQEPLNLGENTNDWVVLVRRSSKDTSTTE